VREYLTFFIISPEFISFGFENCPVQASGPLGSTATFELKAKYGFYSKAAYLPEAEQ
jgi:hypothetical protein